MLIISSPTPVADVRNLPVGFRKQALRFFMRMIFTGEFTKLTPVYFLNVSENKE